jgi:hypothetical protein
MVHYYYDHGGKPRREEPLGSDYGLAIKRWAEIEVESAPPAAAALTFRQVSERYMAEVAILKAPRTLEDNRKERAKLLEFFDDPPGPFEAIQPVNVRQYLTWRTRTGRATSVPTVRSAAVAYLEFHARQGLHRTSEPMRRHQGVQGRRARRVHRG